MYILNKNMIHFSIILDKYMTSINMMVTLNEYKKNIDSFLKKHPDLGDKQIIFSSDDEGNSFQKANGEITPVSCEDIEKDYFLEINEFYSVEDLTKEELDTVNAVCIN
jgi:hypothetical protein